MKDQKKKAEDEINKEVTENNEDQGHKHKHHEHHEKTADELLEEQKDKYLRLAAEFDNYRKRTARERLDMIATAAEETIKGLLPVLDDLERAVKTLKDSGAEVSVIEGTELIHKKLLDYLRSKGLAFIESDGLELNTDFHEAIAQIPVEQEDMKNKIIDTVSKGYTLNGKVIRFAGVVVGI